MDEEEVLLNRFLSGDKSIVQITDGVEETIEDYLDNFYADFKNSMNSEGIPDPFTALNAFACYHKAQIAAPKDLSDWVIDTFVEGIERSCEEQKGVLDAAFKLPKKFKTPTYLEKTAKEQLHIKMHLLVELFSFEATEAAKLVLCAHTLEDSLPESEGIADWPYLTNWDVLQQKYDNEKISVASLCKEYSRRAKTVLCSAPYLRHDKRARWLSTFEGQSAYKNEPEQIKLRQLIANLKES